MSQFDGLLNVKTNQKPEPKSKPQAKPKTTKIFTAQSPAAECDTGDKAAGEKPRH